MHLHDLALCAFLVSIRVAQLRAFVKNDTSFSGYNCLPNEPLCSRLVVQRGEVPWRTRVAGTKVITTVDTPLVRYSDGTGVFYIQNRYARKASTFFKGCRAGSKQYAKEISKRTSSGTAATSTCDQEQH